MSTSFRPEDILEVLDRSAEEFRFPMLDNGYVYLAATRMALFRSVEHWALVFEVFGYSPRAGIPDLMITTIASKLHDRDRPEDYISHGAYENYLANNPNWDQRSFWPIQNEDWMDAAEPELVAAMGTVELRGQRLELPSANEYGPAGIELEEERPAVFELCRILSHTHRKDVLATEAERRVSVLPDMHQLISLGYWHHPDLVTGQMPSQTESFQEIASVLADNDAERFSNPGDANTHWRNWPDGGTL